MRRLFFRNRKRRAGTARMGRTNYNRLDRVGKIGNPFEDFVYSYAMDSTDICSNECWGNSATLVEGPFSATELRNFYGSSFGFLIRTERKEIRKSAGLILHESSDGTIQAVYYDSADKLTKDWEAIQESYYPSDDEELEEDTDDESDTPNGWGFIEGD